MDLKMNNTCFLAIDAGGTYLKGALFSEKGTLVEDSFISVTVNSSGDTTEIKASYQELVIREIRLALGMGLAIEGIGICIPGPFDYAEGVCKMKHKYASIYGIPLRPWFDELISGIAVTFVHDSEAFLRGAIRLDQLQCNIVGGVIIGTGLGFAISQDRNILRNQAGGPKISIFQMHYGNGVAEDYVSKRGIINRYHELTSPLGSRDVYQIAIAAKNGESAAIRVFQETGTHLAAILYDIIKDNEIECLFLGGAISKSAELFLPQLTEGLSGIRSLKHIKKVEDIDNAPLYGIFS
jgi:glucokinase